MSLGAVDLLEALLFVSDAPAKPEQLARAAGLTLGQTEQALEVLSQRLERQGGIQLVRIADGYQLCTKPQFAERVADYLKPQRQRLSRSMMEVLAIVAYKQPITAAEIEQIRGVQSDYGIHGLLERRLIQEVGRKPTPGRPVLYGTTQQFLHHFGLQDLSQLPKLPDGSSADQGERRLPSLFDPE
ncbi:MAG: SMC-Scp complex subunit ScpB [Fimbriimonadales bacterium]|nr:SMC-Scp complex subunit ScpB [Fimbriimonadales bacterium]